MHSEPLLSNGKERGDGTHFNPFAGHCLPNKPQSPWVRHASPLPAVLSPSHLSPRSWAPRVSQGRGPTAGLSHAACHIAISRRRHRSGDSCQPLRADRRLQIYYRSSASAKAHQARGRDAPGGDERIPSVEFMWNKLSTGDISS